LNKKIYVFGDNCSNVTNKFHKKIVIFNMNILSRNGKCVNYLFV